jgi:hypothetical protein
MMRGIIGTIFLSFAVFLQPAQAQIAADGTVQYTIKKGDTLLSLADRYLGSREQYRILQSRNRITNPTALPIGKTLIFDRSLMKYTATTARIIAVRGQVNAAGNAARVDHRYGEGAQIKTAAASFVTLQLENGSKISIPSNSHIVIRLLRRYALDNIIDYDIDLLKGDVRSRVTPSKSSEDRYRVRTPKAVSAVRGTDFQSRYDPATGSDFAEVEEGALAVSSGTSGSTSPLLAGNALAVNAQGGVTIAAMTPAPRLIEPGKIQADTALRFTAEQDRDASGYRFALASDAGFIDQIADISSKDPTLNFEAVPNGNYFVRARTVSANGTEGLPVTYAFKRRLNGVIASSGKSDEGYNFKWTSEGDGIKRFHFQLYKGESDGVPMVDEAGVTSGLVRISDLPTGTYFWRVGALQYLDGEWAMNWTSFEKIEATAN